jgi:hypothetical protein
MVKYLANHSPSLRWGVEEEMGLISMGGGGSDIESWLLLLDACSMLMSKKGGRSSLRTGVFWGLSSFEGDGNIQKY